MAESPLKSLPNEEIEMKRIETNQVGIVPPSLVEAQEQEDQYAASRNLSKQHNEKGSLLPEITQTRSAGIAARNIALAEQRSQDQVDEDRLPSQESSHPDEKADPNQAVSDLISPKEEQKAFEV